MTRRSSLFPVLTLSAAATLTGTTVSIPYCPYAYRLCNSSGFEGPWTFSPITLTNDFYKLLLSEKFVIMYSGRHVNLT